MESSSLDMKILIYICFIWVDKRYHKRISFCINYLAWRFYKIRHTNSNFKPALGWYNNIKYPEKPGRDTHGIVYVPVIVSTFFPSPTFHIMYTFHGHSIMWLFKFQCYSSGLHVAVNTQLSYSCQWIGL